MAISYNIYANNGQGGDVNYAMPIATTSGLTFTTGPLATPSDNSFGVRAFDAASGIEEANTDARIRIILDASGNDVTARPNAVVGLSACPMAGGTCYISWGYDAMGQGGAPSQFDVTLTPASTVATPASPVSYLPGVPGYSCSLSGLSSNTTYTIAVQAVGASNGLLGPAATIEITYRIAQLSNVDSLVAIPSA